MKNKVISNIDKNEKAGVNYLIMQDILSSECSSADDYILNHINNSPGAHIGSKNGLDEKLTVELVEKLFESRKNNNQFQALQRYLESLRHTKNNSYRALGQYLPEGLGLDEIYVPISVDVPKFDRSDLTLADALKIKKSHLGPQIMLEGAPGSGKSTLLRHIARYAWHNPGLVGLDKRYIPLSIRLRTYSEAEGATREDKIRATIGRSQELEIIECNFYSGFYKEWPLLAGAPWLFLLDGYDEVDKDRASDIQIWLSKLIDEEIPLFVSSRPTNNISDAIRLRLVNCYIHPFSSAQQISFTNKWFGDGALSFREQFSHFAEGELGGTPLLLTIAAIVFSREGCLPTHRGELYRQFVDQTWREAMRRGAKADLGEGFGEYAEFLIPKCLQQIARNMTERRDNESLLDFYSDVKLLAEALVPTLQTDLNISESLARFRAEQLTHFLGAHSGVFWTAGHDLEWLHPTFREFLAAEAFVLAGDESNIYSILSKFNDSSWRQVIIFILSILSEVGEVTNYVRSLIDQSPPYGLTLAATAINEGANVDEQLLEEITARLSEEVVSKARYGFCERLLVAADGGQARRVLNSLLRSRGNGEATRKLEYGLTSMAIDYGSDGSSAVHDLGELRAEDALVALSFNDAAPLLVRTDAAAQLKALGCIEKSLGAFKILLKIIPQVAERGQIAKLLSRTVDPEFLARLASEANISEELWNNILDRLGEIENCTDFYAVLAADVRLLPDMRMAVLLRTNISSDQFLLLIKQIENSESLLRVGITSAVKKNHDGILSSVASSPTYKMETRILAVRGLRSLKNYNGLYNIVADHSVPYKLRRRAAEGLYKSELPEQGSRQLLKFFESLRKHAWSPPVLVRRAYLQYKLGEYQKVVELFEALSNWRESTAWEAGVRGHSLELLGLIDAALACYSEAIAKDGKSIFPRCRRAYLYWSRGEYEKALADVDGLDKYMVPEWFVSVGGDIFREMGLLKQAQDWLDVAVKQSPTSSQALALRAILEFDNGKFDASIGDLEQALSEQKDYIWARFQLAKVFRAANQIDNALDVYNNLLEGDPSNANYRGLQAEALLRARRVSEASQIIHELRMTYASEPFFVLLEVILVYLSDETEFIKKRRGKELSSAGLALISGNEDIELSTSALLYLAMGECGKGNEIIRDMCDRRRWEQLRFFTYPFLENLASTLVVDGDIAELRDWLEATLWTNGRGVRGTQGFGEAILAKIHRGDYPIPMYCQKYSIEGLDEDVRVAKEILIKSGSGERIVIMWNLAVAEDIFGLCNFKKDLDADYELKFSEKKEKLLHVNLSLLVKRFGVGLFLFMQTDLCEEVRTALAARRLKAECKLVEGPIELGALGRI